MDLQYFQNFQSWLHTTCSQLDSDMATGEDESGQFCSAEPNAKAFGQKVERLKNHLQSFILKLPMVPGSTLDSHNINPLSTNDMQALVVNIENNPAYIVAVLEQNVASIASALIVSQSDESTLASIKVQILEHLVHSRKRKLNTYVIIHLQRLLNKINRMMESSDNHNYFSGAADIIVELIKEVALPPELIDYTLLKSFHSGSVPPFFMEAQPDRDNQGCGTYAANAFFGGSVLTYSPSSDAINDDNLITRMKQGCRTSPMGVPMPAPDSLMLYHSTFSNGLLHKINALKSDRFVLMSGLNTHYVTFRRDRNGDWYRLDSTKYGNQEQIDPAEYLKQIYHGQDPASLSISDSHISIIAYNGEELPIATLSQ